MWSGLKSFDEYGNKLAVSQDKNIGALNYSWLGGKERATDLPGLVLVECPHVAGFLSGMDRFPVVVDQCG